MLADTSVARVLRDRKIVHVPDFVSNAGGLIACAAEILDPADTVGQRVENIANTTRVVLSAAFARNRTPTEVALSLAEERIDAGTTSWSEITVSALESAGRSTAVAATGS